MDSEQLKSLLTSLFPTSTFEEGGEWVNMIIDPANLPEVATIIRTEPMLHMDFLFCLTCIDWKTHFTMVYHFSSTMYRHNLVIKAVINREDPVIDSLAHKWRTAEFHEREVYDLFGVKFNNHPDLRRLFLTDEWKGYPLRKDFEDPVNMIKL